MAEQASTSDTRPMHDVAIVGLGPVGQVLGLLLAQKGHKVVVVEKQDKPYPLPRAVHYDPDISRLLDGLGLSDFLDEFASATPTYEWQTVNRETMLRFDFALEGNQGWPDATMFNQPALEERLRKRGTDFENIKVYRGTEVVGFDQDADGVELRITSRTLKQRTIRARYAIGCDGSNSFIRQYMNTAIKDLGFFYDWLIVDILPKDPSNWSPDNLQVCDPARPTSYVCGGPGRRRFEFMRMPEDDLTTFNTDDNAWSLMEPWGITAENTDLERRAVYTFQAKWAEAWSDGRVFLAGDAAHQMPPFYGQGMVSGVRDSVNLAWKLDLVLRGIASEQLLETYDSERSAHVQHAIGMSVELGKMICETDPVAVANRDEHFLTRGPVPQDALPPMPPERLGLGAFPAGDPTLSTVAGLIGVQGRVGRSDGYVDLLDRCTFGQFVVLCDGRVVDAGQAMELSRRLPAGLPATIVRVLPLGGDLSEADAGEVPGVLTVTDDDVRYLPYLEACGHVAQIFRPDFYIYEGSADYESLLGLLDTLPDALSLVPLDSPASTGRD